MRNFFKGKCDTLYVFVYLRLVYGITWTYSRCFDYIILDSEV